MNKEIEQLEKLSISFPRYFRMQTRNSECTVETNQHSFEMADSESAFVNTPVLAIFAGVHGIESIGVRILVNFIDHILRQTQWNQEIRSLLKKVKIIGIPIVNPEGFANGTRCNKNGVDLMRNAPVESFDSIPFLGGQKLSPKLPYFKGFGYLENENESLVRFVQNKVFNAPFSISLDIHSGFGARDFIWTPWAKNSELPPRWNFYQRFHEIMDQTLKQNIYKFEPQSMSYCTGGDVWDLLFSKSIDLNNVYLPLTLEVGSWLWLKKAPMNIFKEGGLFNPLQIHREQRTLRRHLSFLNFLTNSVANHKEFFRSL